MIQKPKIRINFDTFNKLKTIKENKKLKSYPEVIDYLLEKAESPNEDEGLINSKENLTEEKLNKILAAANYNSKILSLLEEFSNTVADGLVLDENKNSTSNPTTWYKQAKVEVENKIQTKRTKNLSNFKED